MTYLRPTASSGGAGSGPDISGWLPRRRVLLPALTGSEQSPRQGDNIHTLLGISSLPPWAWHFPIPTEPRPAAAILLCPETRVGAPERPQEKRYKGRQGVPHLSRQLSPLSALLPSAARESMSPRKQDYTSPLLVHVESNIKALHPMGHLPTPLGTSYVTNGCSPDCELPEGRPMSVMFTAVSLTLSTGPGIRHLLNE